MMGKNPSRQRGDPRLPVDQASWFDALVMFRKPPPTLAEFVAALARLDFAYSAARTRATRYATTPVGGRTTRKPGGVAPDGGRRKGTGGGLLRAVRCRPPAPGVRSVREAAQGSGRGNLMRPVSGHCPVSRRQAAAPVVRVRAAPTRTGSPSAAASTCPAPATTPGRSTRSAAPRTRRWRRGSSKAIRRTLLLRQQELLPGQDRWGQAQQRPGRRGGCLPLQGPVRHAVVLGSQAQVRGSEGYRPGCNEVMQVHRLG